MLLRCVNYYATVINGVDRIGIAVLCIRIHRSGLKNGYGKLICAGGRNRNYLIGDACKVAAYHKAAKVIGRKVHTEYGVVAATFADGILSCLTLIVHIIDELGNIARLRTVFNRSIDEGSNAALPCDADLRWEEVVPVILYEPLAGIEL